MIPVKRNHFYTKEIISNAVGIYPQFKDMTSSTETTFEFKGGLGATRYVISGQTSETPFPGQSELVGGYFQSYVTGMSVSGGAMLPVMTGYKLQDGFPIKEGGLTMATGSTTVAGGTTDTIGDKLWVSTSIIDAGTTWLEENFDGADKSLGTALMQQSASATLSLADAYVSPKQGADNLFMGGDAFFGGGASNDAEHNLGKYFSDGGPSGDRSRVYVRPVKKNRMEGLWTAVDDYRNDKQKWQIYAPYWKWNTVRGILNFDKKDAATNNEDALPNITTNNTIFNDLYRTKSYGSTFTYNSDSPYLESAMELTSSQGGTGQALRMYHSWGVSGDPKNNWNYWVQMLRHKSVEVQTNYASLYDIPYPIPNNVGAFGQTSITSGAMGVGDQRIAYPEINLSMNIAKLMPAPAISHAAGAAIVGTNAICYGNQSGSNDVEGTTQRAMNADSSFKSINKTFWRSVVVTFSNYTPEEASAQTLDQFLRYGMDQAFGLITGSGDVAGAGKADFTNDQMGPKIVCGVVFESFYSTDSGISSNLDGSGSLISPTSVYAYSLPVSRTFESGTTGGSYDEQYGMIRCTGGTSYVAPDNTMLHRPVMGPLTGSSKTGRPYVEIPQGETFNMKVVFDVQQPWWKGTDYGWYMEDTDTSNNQYTFPTASEDVYGSPAAGINNVVGGVPIRAYFDTIKPPRQGDPNTDTTNLPDYDEDKVPYINVGLPAYDSPYFHQYMSDMDVWGNRQSGLSPAYKKRGGNFLFPKHMTIWVSNCGMAPASGSTPTYWNSTNTWFDSTYWVSDDYAFPLNSDGDWTGPATIESEVFIDSIKFKNWGAGTVSQHSAMAGPLRKFMSSNTQGVPSPAKTVDKGANQSHARNFSVDGHLPEIPAGQILTLGVKHKDWVMQHVEAAPAGGTEGGSVGAKASYLLFNNFSATQFGEIDRFTPTVGWMSTKTAAGSDSEGSYVSAAGWDMWGQIASGSDADVQATQGESQTMFIQTGASIAPSTGTPFTRSYYSGEVYEGQVYASFGYSNTDTQDFLSTDGLTQKGFVKLTVSSGSANTNIHARENPMCSAKIMEIGEKSANLEGSTELTKNTIRVDEIDIFMEDADDDYIIYRAGEYLTENEIAGTSDPTTALGYVMTVKASEIDADNDIVKLVVTDASDNSIGGGIKYADDETTELCVGKHLSQLYISPKRIWFNMLLVGENWQYPRKYESVNIVGEKPSTGSIATQLGTTFNEATYTYNTGSMTTKGLSAMPENPWIFDPAEEATAVIANKDYGFGAYDESGNKGAEVGKETPIINKHMSLDFSGVVDADKLAPNSECSMVLNLSSDVTNKAFTIVADDTTLDLSGSTYYRPQYIWEYKDALPTVTEFQVGSAFDVLSPDVNLYELTKQPINNLKFTWSEEAEDIWYRHLIVNPSGGIENKYHNCSFWAPLNEPNISYVTGEQVPASYYTTHTQGMTKKTLNAPAASIPVTQYHSRVDGIQGYALWKNSNIKSLQFTDSGSICATTGTQANGIEVKNSMYYDMSDGVYGTIGDNPWQNAWTLVVHCNPNNQDADSATKTEGMTVCGVAMYQNAANSGSSGAGPDVTIQAPSGVSDGNYASGSLTWNSWNPSTSGFAATRGGFDVLHVYVKDNKVFCHYNYENTAIADANTVEYFKTLQYEVLLLSSSTAYPLDGTEPMSITIVFQGRNTPTGGDTSTNVRSDDQFRMYINGQLEDSTSATRGTPLNGQWPNPYDQNCKGVGGFSRANFSQFVIGAFDTGDGSLNGAPPHIGNITAEIGDTTTSPKNFTPTKYDNRVNGFHGTIEEIILYPYEVYMVPNANEFVLETNTLPDYTSTGSTGIEKNYNARLFLYDYTNIRGKASDEVAATTPVQWKVTGV
tara:strand:- start:5329 stop:10938 length:5610 start_codon:yes stop_codon:yes gene_type:complete